MPPIELTRQYYHDSYRQSFESVVVETPDLDGKPGAILESTCFYPSSGGQPNDRGRLGNRTVVDVVIRESDGAIVHLLDGPVPLGAVIAEIDWPRRLDHMQQHTGQHILSQAFIRVLEAPTIGFHLGQDYVSIDLETPSLEEAARDRAVTIANEAVRADLPVRAWFPSETELAEITLRKTPDVEGALRVVAIGDFDVSACGGTHVARTGEVGLIHCLRTERLKRGARVSFLCGDRARADYAAKHRILMDLSGALTCSAAEVPAAVARLQAELTAARRGLEKHHEESLDREAVTLRNAAAGDAERVMVIAKQWQGRSADDLKGLALRLTVEPNVVVLLATVGDRTQFVFGRADQSTLNLKPALDAAFAVIGGGKGGGGRLVQGGGAVTDPARIDEALAAARATLVAR